MDNGKKEKLEKGKMEARIRRLELKANNAELFKDKRDDFEKIEDAFWGIFGA